MSRLIDADALIDDIKNNLWDWETVDGITATTVLKQTISDIGNQPTIEERKGKWLQDKHDIAGYGYFDCSECGADFYDTYDFCPNCGAKMEGEEDAMD